MSTPTYDAFISYASADFARAQAVFEVLKSKGFRVWFDRDRLKPGFDWHREVEAGCEASLVMLPVLTPRWKQSMWACYETYAHDAIIPLQFEGEVGDVFTPPLLRYQSDRIDLTTVEPHDWDRLVACLRERVDGLRQNPPDRVARVAKLRYPRNEFFVGRDAKMNEMLERLFVSPTTAITQGRVQAVTAHGGVGKTTLASEFAQRYWRLYRQIFWVDCRLGLEPEFAQIAIQVEGEDALKGVDIPTRARRALAHLNNPHAKDRCLLILDNADDEAALTLRDISNNIVGSWIPAAGSCHTIITSRFTGWSPAIQKTELFVLDPEPACVLVASRAGANYHSLPEPERKACADVAEALGRLPLALEVAGAFIRLEGKGYTFAEYLSRYLRSQELALKDHSLGFTAYPEPVFTTWRITIDKLSPAARAMIRLCARFGAAPIPLGMLLGFGKELAELGTLITAMPAAVPEPGPDIVRGFKTELTNYSLATPGPELKGVGQSIAFHNLTQAVERHATPDDQRPAWAAAAGAAFRAFEPEGNPQTNIAGWARWEPLSRHAEPLADHLAQHRQSEEAARILNDCSVYLQMQARFGEAEPLMRRALTILESSLGKDHPQVATALNNLAQLLQATDRLSEAEPLMRRALTIDEASYGKEHPNVATDLNNLAALLKATNRVSEAEPLMRRALTIDEASYGKEHPKVAIRLNNLAQVLQDTNRLSEAEPLMRRALTIDEASYGKEHPEVATDLNNLALLLQATNRLSEAEPLMRRALTIDEASYGKEHPNVAIRLNNLAALLQDTDRLSEAAPLMRRALTILESSLGKDHPQVATALNNLAQLLKATNRLSEAEPLMRRALTIDETSCGKEHPKVAIRLNNLAQLLQATNRLTEAEPLMRRALTILESSLGKDHPQVATALNNLAALLKATNRLSEAEPLMRRALTIDETSYGKQHPNVAIGLNNLAQLLQATNRLSEAEPLMRRALMIDEASYGKEHPDVATDLNNLAALLKATNRLSEAEPLMRRALTIDEASYGKEHPNVATDLNNLAALLKATNRVSEAEPLMRRALTIDEASYGKEHPKVAIRLNNLAQVLQDTNRLSEAEPLMRRVVEILLKFTVATGHEHPHLRAALGNYGGLLKSIGSSDAQIRAALEALLNRYGLSLGGGS